MPTRKAAKRRIPGSSRASGALAAAWPWGPAWLRWLEIGWAAPQVIAHRTQRMLRSGPFPGDVDRGEFRRMVDEKGEAWLESALQMSAEFWKVWFAIAASAMQPWWPAPATAATRAWPSPIAWRADGWHSAYRGAARRWMRSAPHIAYVGLGPVHRRATANARRLARSVGRN
ncbi:MAG TPA: polyhydroxyalkanoate granule-associated phasin [Zeimonas sp.]